MKKMVYVFSAIFCLGIIYCSTGKPKESTLDVQNKIIFSIEPGEHWYSKMKVFIFSVKNNPQLAVWIEDDNGNYVSTVMVTKKSAKGNWMSAPKEGRPEALPVWNHKYQNNQSINDVDILSSATPKGSVLAAIEKETLVSGNSYNVYLEINHSFDYNDHWTKDNSGVNGQPSLVYHAQFTAGMPDRISLVPVGHGSVDGSNGNITGELGSLTTALGIVKSASIVVK